MEVLTYDGVVLNGAVIIFDTSRLILLFRIVRDVCPEFTSLRGTGGSIDVLIASISIASVIGEGIGIGDGIVGIVEVTIGFFEDLPG